MLYKNAKIFIGCKEHMFLKNGFIFFEEGLIKAVGDMNSCKKQYSKKGEKDFSGFTIYPGFIDAHSHIGMWETALDFEGADGNEETDPITPHFRAIDAVNPCDESFSKALRHGITTVVTGPGSSNPIAGSFVALKTSGNCVDNMIIKDPVGIKFSLGENPKRTYSEKEMTPSTRMGVAALIREYLEKAKIYEKKLKEDDLDLDFEMKSNALIPLLNRKIKALFHCHRADDIFTAIRISKEFNLDFILIHATEGHLIKEHLKGMNLVLGPLISDISKPELKNFNEQSPYILTKAKAKVSICTDSPVVPEKYLNLSCAIAIKHGLSKKDAIFSITKNPALMFNIYDLVGSIEVGKMANFAIFRNEDDIFSVCCKPSFVVLDGKTV